MILDIVNYGDPVLRTKGAPVGDITEELKRLAADMIDTMRDADGVGLAAQQVGVPLQMAVLDVAASEDRPSSMHIAGQAVDFEKLMPMVLLNPQLELSKEKESGTEGCLSFPEMSAQINRSATVRARARLLDGSEIDFEASGLLARALQHEVDHLHGVLFIDRMNAATKVALSGKLKRLQKAQRR
jgi:peptide deformylase